MDFDDFIDLIAVMSDHVRKEYCCLFLLSKCLCITDIYINKTGLGFQDLWYMYNHTCKGCNPHRISFLDFNEDEFIDAEDLNHVLDNLTGGALLPETKNEIITYVRTSQL